MQTKLQKVLDLMDEGMDFVEAAAEEDVTQVEALDMISAVGHVDVFAYLELRTSFDEENAS